MTWMIEQSLVTSDECRDRLGTINTMVSFELGLGLLQMCAKRGITFTVIDSVLSLSKQSRLSTAPASPHCPLDDSSTRRSVVSQ
jgi:hypothetical protein